MGNSKPKIKEINYMRALAIIAVVILHATGPFMAFGNISSKTMLVSFTINQLARFCLPMFVFVSGLVLMYNYGADRELNFLRFIKSRLIDILIPYIIWSVIYFALFNRGAFLSIFTNPAQFADFLKNLLFGWHFCHLYFVIMIFQFYLLFPFFRKLILAFNNRKGIFISTCFIVYLAFVAYINHFKVTAGVWFIDIIQSYYWEMFIGWFPYFIFGGVIALHLEKFKEWLMKFDKIVIVFYMVTSAVIIIEMALFLIRYGSSFVSYIDLLNSIRVTVVFYSVSAILFYYLIFMKISGRDNVWTRALQDTGTYSFGIYFVHPLILELLKHYLYLFAPNHFNYTRPLYLIVLFLLTFVPSLIFCYGISILRLNRVFIGKSPFIDIKAMFQPKGDISGQI